MKILGTVLMIGGLIALVITGLDYMDNTKSLNLFGESFTISKGDISSVIISALVFIIGLFIRTTAKK